MNKKIWLPVLVVVLGVLLAGLMLLQKRETQRVEREPLLPLVRVQAVEVQPHRFIVHAQGTVTPHTDAFLVSEVAGRVQWVAPAFAVGGFFEAGDLLLRLDPREYELAVVRANAALAEAQLRLQREQAEAEIARNEWEMLRKSEATKGEGPGTKDQRPGQAREEGVDRGANALLLREPQLAEAKAALESARANLELAKLNLERCEVKAPFAGRVREKMADAGQYVGKGERVARIYAVDYAEVRLPLPLDELAYVDLPVVHRDGAASGAQEPPVILRARIGRELHEWHGRIVRTEGEVDPRTRMLTAVARVDDPYGLEHGRAMPLAIGLFVDAEIMGREAGEVILAPRSAMRGKDRMLVVEEDRLRIRPVEVIRFEGDQVVVGNGLRSGDLVCTSPLDAAVDGMRVKPTRESARDRTGIMEGNRL